MQLSKLGLAGPCLEDSKWGETESLGCSAETWSQRLNKSELGLLTFNRVRSDPQLRRLVAFTLRLVKVSNFSAGSFRTQFQY